MSEVPDVASRRLSATSFSSGLSAADFAACLNMGLEPVGLVQGFCVVRFSNYQMGGVFQNTVGPSSSAKGAYVENFQCPHGMVSSEHRMWGQNLQQTWVENTWSEGFSRAYSRMVDEATTLGAHGVVGVVDDLHQLGNEGMLEFTLRGTAVVLPGVPTMARGPWTTYLAGQRLAKVIEAGYAPVSVVAAVSSIRVMASCVTQYLMGGGGATMWAANAESLEVGQIVRARTAARQLVRGAARDQLHGDALHGVDLRIQEHEYGEGDMEIQPLLRGNRVRRFKDFDPLEVPQLMVRLS